jgi:pimeloyl-ACP methyl ester carboxylesterase
MSTPDVSVVLVHGAWADGSSWAKVIAPLAAEGFPVMAPSLPLTSLQDDVAAVERALERASGSVVLVGHAYGGAVISAVRSDKVKALVYVAAGAPDEGETVLEAFYGAQPPQLEPDRHGAIHLPGPAFGAAFAPDATPDEQAVLAAVQRPISTACITVPLARPLWRDTPAWFLVAEQDRLLSPDRQLSMAKRMRARLHAFAVDHAPLVSAPWAVLSVLREAIGGLTKK